jgi:hypothetical protein
MWIFTTVGFFSVVQKPGEEGVQVRARAAEDLDRLRANIITPLCPYRWVFEPPTRPMFPICTACATYRVPLSLSLRSTTAPATPPPPEMVDLDGWLKAVDGLRIKRTVRENGSASVDKHDY